MGRNRRILHLDVDSFLASLEQVREPGLRGRPVVVGSGVVASCSPEAKARGVCSAMAMTAARRICPELVVVEGDSARAAACQVQLEKLIRCRTPVVERTSLDDFYADLTGTPGTAAESACWLRREVRRELGLSVAQGIGTTRVVARLATDLAKPGRIMEISPGREKEFLAGRRVELLPGVGRRTQELFRRLGVQQIGDLRRLGRANLARLLGRRGVKLWQAAQAVECDPVVDGSRRQRRQVSRETSLAEPTADVDLLAGLLSWLLDRALATLRSEGLRARRLEVVIRYADNLYATRAERMQPGTDSFAVLHAAARRCFAAVQARRLLLRGVGVRLACGGQAQGVQEGLWDAAPGQRERLEIALGRIRKKHGFGRVLRGGQVLLLGQLPTGHEGFRLRTPSLSK